MSRPPPHSPEIDDEYAELALDMVDEALADYAGELGADTLEAIRAELTDRLLATDAGRQLLRQIQPDPAVHVSGDVTAKGAEAPAAPPKRAAGDDEGSR
jgi:hypothetical protein